MKTQFIFALLLIVVFAQSGKSPRSDHSCDDNTGEYWDGQKCEICSDATCKCSSYNGCDSCQDGYGKYTNKESIPICRSCDGSGTKACCVIYENGETVTRATECYARDSDETSGYRYQLYGSYCYAQQYCRVYTDYGRCVSCYDGYYLDRNSACKTCMGNSGGTGKVCEICHTQGQCSKCADGFYLSSNQGKETAEDDVVLSASLCKACTVNCICDATKPCKACLNDTFLFSETANTCTLCSLSIANCVSCSSVDTCTKCLTGFVLSTDKKDCKKCPDNCNDCFFDSSIQEPGASCRDTGCYNTFYYSKNQSGVGICTKCKGANVLRCKGTDGTEITECGPADLATGFDAARNAAPHKTQFYLINNANGEQVCMSNTNNCKKMISGTEFAGKCESCYTELRYVLNNDKVCVLCDITGCLKCKAAAAGNGLECEQCENNQDSIIYKQAQPNYYLKTGTCASCPASCLACDNDTGKCTECQKGFRLNADTSNCELCAITNCMKCTESTAICDKCFSGNNSIGYVKFYKQDKQFYQCETCEEHCAECEYRKVCQKCMDGYYLFNNVCQIKKKECKIYEETGGKCKQCDYGYRLVDGWCHTCVNDGQVNCPEKCDGTGFYRRDGDQLTETTQGDAAYGNILTLSVLLFSVLSFLIQF